VATAVIDRGLELTDAELAAVVRLVYERSGITLHDGKRALIVARLQKRVRQGAFASFGAYLRHVASDRSGEELTLLLDAIATNHTSFFREPQHFTFLNDVILPPFDGGARGPLLGWSAACSTGEEPYTIAMTILDRLGPVVGATARLHASDLSTKALATAERGIYRADRVDGVPMPTLKKYFEKGLGSETGLVRVGREARAMVEFRQANLLELPPSATLFDFIFCRNVMIYFDTAVRQRVVAALEQRLKPGGHLFISHSEGLTGVKHGLRWVAPAIYRKDVA
jgi:chemotaxis protein methyltransferase CheR